MYVVAKVSYEGQIEGSVEWKNKTKAVCYLYENKQVRKTSRRKQCNYQYQTQQRRKDKRKKRTGEVIKERKISKNTLPRRG